MPKNKQLAIIHKKSKKKNHKRNLTKNVKEVVAMVSRELQGMKSTPNKHNKQLTPNIKIFTKLIRANQRDFEFFIRKCLLGIDSRFDSSISNLMRDLSMVNDSYKTETKRLLMRTNTQTTDKKTANMMLGLSGDVETSQMINSISSNDRNLSLQISSQDMHTVMKGLEKNVTEYNRILTDIQMDKNKYESLNKLTREINRDSGEKWLDLSTLYSMDRAHMGISIDVNKIQKLVKTTKLTGELLSDFLRSSAMKTPEIIIRIGRCSLLISAHMLLAMIDLMMRCSTTFIMFKDSLLGLAGFTDKYSPQLFYVFYSLFVSPVFSIKENPVDDPKQLQKFYIFRIYSNLFAICYSLGIKYYTGGDFNQEKILEVGLSKIKKACQLNSLPNLAEDPEANSLFEYMGNIIPYLLLKYTSTAYGIMIPSFNTETGKWSIGDEKCPRDSGPWFLSKAAKRSHRKKHKKSKKHKKKRTKKP
jgi:hypothetical protein